MRCIRTFCCLICMLGCLQYASGQSILKKKIEFLKNTGITFDKVELFKNDDIAVRQIPGENTAYMGIGVDRQALLQLYNSKPDNFEISVKLNSNELLDINFTASRVIDESTVYHTISGKTKTDFHPSELPLTYWGVIKNEMSNNSVALTISSSTLQMNINRGSKNIEIKSLGQNTNIISAGIFENLKAQKSFDFTCGNTSETATPEELNFVKQSNAKEQILLSTPLPKCVRVYVQCADSFRLQQGGGTVALTIERVVALFNQSGLAYFNENINTSLSAIGVFTSADSYDHSTRDAGLQSFKDAIQNNFTGDMAIFFDWTSRRISGVADGFGTLCVPYGATTDGPYIYNDMNYDNYYSNFPVAADAPQVYLIVHEMGHILGSRHTHWCGWVGGAIDNCFAVEGTCNAGPTPTIGTFMSYCCTNSAIGITFNAGFGTQPGNVIRNFVNNSCIGTCTSSCAQQITIANPVDNINYKYEAANTINALSTISASSTIRIDAGKVIQLLPGFRAIAGGTVVIVIDGCGGL